MANNCSTRIVLFGNDKALADIRTRLESRAVSHVNDVMKIYGIDEEFRWGEVLSIEFFDDHIFIEQDDAWSPRTEPWERLAEYYEGDIAFVYIAEEPGCEIYVNTDIEHRFFYEYASVDYHLPKSDDHTYLSDEADVLSLLRDIYKQETGDELPDEVDDVNKAALLLDNYVEVMNSDRDSDDYFFSFNIYSSEY